MVLSLAISLALNVVLLIVVVLGFPSVKERPKHRRGVDVLMSPKDIEWAQYINSRANAIRDHGFSFFEVDRGELVYVNN